MDASVLESVVGVVVGSLVGFVVGSVVGFVVIVLGFSVWPVVPVSSVGLVQPVSIPINVMTAILRQISFFIVLHTLFLKIRIMLLIIIKALLCVCQALF